MLQKRNIERKNKGLDVVNKQHEVEESTKSDREIIASLKSCVEEAHKRAEIDRLVRLGVPIAEIVRRYQT